MKCPYCGQKGAKVLPNIVGPAQLIHSALNCRNPECTAYDPITHGDHPRMSAESRDTFQKIITAVREESDFALISMNNLKKYFTPR